MDRSVLRPYTLFPRRGVTGVGAPLHSGLSPSVASRFVSVLAAPADIAPVECSDETEFERLRLQMASRRSAVAAVAAAAAEAAAVVDGARLRTLAALTRVQACVRGWLRRRHDIRHVKSAADAEGAATTRARHVAAAIIQSAWRHYAALLHREDGRLRGAGRCGVFVALVVARRAKVAARRAREAVAAAKIQHCARGWMARRYLTAVKKARARKAAATQAATRLQAAWKRHVARREFVALRIMHLAASEIQRVFRGWSAARAWRRLSAIRHLEPTERVKAMLVWCAEQHVYVQAAIKRCLADQERLALQEARVVEAATVSRRVASRLAAGQTRLHDAETSWAWLTWLQGDPRVLAAVATRMVATVAAACTLNTASIPLASAWFAAVFDAATAANSMTAGYTLATAGMLMLRRAHAAPRRRSTGSIPASVTTTPTASSNGRSALKPAPLVTPPPALSPSAKAAVMMHLSSAFSSVKDKVRGFGAVAVVRRGTSTFPRRHLVWARRSGDAPHDDSTSPPPPPRHTHCTPDDRLHHRRRGEARPGASHPVAHG